MSKNFEVKDLNVNHKFGGGKCYTSMIKQTSKESLQVP
jgi:hypothetical protein